MIYLFLFFLISHYAIQGIYCAVDQRHICARMHRTCPNIEPQRYKLFLNASLFFQKNEQISPRASLHSTLSIRPLSAALFFPQKTPFLPPSQHAHPQPLLQSPSNPPPTPLQPLYELARCGDGEGLEGGWRGFEDGTGNQAVATARTTGAKKATKPSLKAGIAHVAQKDKKKSPI